MHLPAPVLALVGAARRALGSPPRHEHSLPYESAETLTDYALRHGMVAWAPAPLRHETVLAHGARALHAVRQLLDIVERFSENGVTVVALKGPVFSQWLYGDSAARRCSDLDLLVSTATRDSARHLLEQIGFRRQIPAGPGDVVYASLGAWPMVHASELAVDLHWRLASRRFPQPLDPADVLRGAIEVPIGGRTVRAPRPEHAAILTLMHSAKHLWYALELPFSIAALVRRTDIDWEVVRDVTARGGALRAAAAGIALAAELFDVDVPPPFRRDVWLSDVRSLCRCASAALSLPPGTFADRRLERRMHLLAIDRQTDRLFYDIRRVTEPTRAEWECVSLPTGLAGLYWPGRLVRLAVMSTTAVIGRSARERSLP